MDLKLNGKTALVTGATAGIGLEIARTLAVEGAVVTLTGRSQPKLDAALASIRASGGERVNGVLADAATAEGAQAILRAAAATDILVNNLGIYESKAFGEITDADWLNLFEVNVLSGVRLARAYLPGMLERNWGRLIFIGGIALYTGSVHTARDCAKTACIGMMRSLSLLGTPHQVTSNMVHPGFVDTKHDDVKFQGNDERRDARMKKHRMGHGSHAEDPAGMVLFLASENGRFISGQELFVTGGMPPHLGI